MTREEALAWAKDGEPAPEGPLAGPSRRSMRLAADLISWLRSDHTLPEPPPQVRLALRIDEILAEILEAKK